MTASFLAPSTKYVEDKAQGRQVVAAVRRHSGTVFRIDDSSGVRPRVIRGCAFREGSVHDLTGALVRVGPEVRVGPKRLLRRFAWPRCRAKR